MRGEGQEQFDYFKYFSPRINISSCLTLYDLPVLKRAKELFGVMDMWVTYSW